MKKLIPAVPPWNNYWQPEWYPFKLSPWEANKTQHKGVAVHAEWNVLFACFYQNKIIVNPLFYNLALDLNLLLQINDMNASGPFSLTY